MKMKKVKQLDLFRKVGNCFLVCDFAFHLVE